MGLLLRLQRLEEEVIGPLGKGFILWIMGIPVSLVVLLWLFGFLK